MQRPKIQRKARRDAKVYKIPEGIQLCTNFAFAFQQARKSAIKAVQHRGNQNKPGRQRKLVINRKPDRRQPGTQRRNRHHVGDQLHQWQF